MKFRDRKYELPPVIEIIESQYGFKKDSVQDLRKLFADHGLLSDLRQAAESSLSKFSYEDGEECLPDGQFSITLSSAMNPFLPEGKCNNVQCLDDFIDKFIRTVGLYADRAIIPDPLSGFFLRAETINYENLSRRFHVIKQIFPLIDAGIIRFGKPVYHYCKGCYAKFEQTIDEVATRLAESAKTDCKVSFGSIDKSDYLTFENPILFRDLSHPLLLCHKLTKKESAFLGTIMKGEDIVKNSEADQLVFKVLSNYVKTYVRDIFLEMNSARKTHSTFLCGSRAETVFLNEFEGKSPDLSRIEHWESMRSLNLPWISELSAENTLQLREEAHKALPELRNLIARRLSDPSMDFSEGIHKMIDELQDKVADVESELESLAIPKEKRYRAGMAGLALSLVVYGLSSGTPTASATSIAALLATIAHLRSRESDIDSKLAKIQASPAYVLFRAKEILKKPT